VSEQLKSDSKALANTGKSEEELRADYRRIAERRVRLGLVVGEIGEKSKLEVSQEELKRALIEQANRYPGQQRHVYEFYEKNPAALAELRAPIFEDKVIDHIIEQAKPAEKKVSVEELLKPVEGDDDMGLALHRHDHHDHDHDHHHGPDHDHDHPHDPDHTHDHAHGGHAHEGEKR
jgi:trigger factor